MAAAYPPDDRSARLLSTTGAATSRVVVKVAAAGTGPDSLTMSARSSPDP
jgi:hypothetical protein